jgi:hypothetical protein
MYGNTLTPNTMMCSLPHVLHVPHRLKTLWLSIVAVIGDIMLWR